MCATERLAPTRGSARRVERMEAYVSAVSPGVAGQIGVELSDQGARIAVASVGDAPERLMTVRHARLEPPVAPDDVVERIVQLVEETRGTGEAPISRVGVAAWGRVNPAAGVIDDTRFGPQWEGYPLCDRLAARLGAPVRIATGTRAAARAEAIAGAGAGRSPVLYLHLGRSVTSALVIDGEPLVGARYDEGRLAHWQTGLDGPRCVCGARGHLEPLVSAQSLIRLAIGVAADDDVALAAIHRVTGGRAEALTAPQLVTLAGHGVGPLRQLLDVVTDALSGAIANLVVTLDPAAVLIGGPLAQGDAVFFDWLRERVGARLAGVSAPPEIGPAVLGSRGALLGAALL